jgi:putative transposase
MLAGITRHPTESWMTQMARDAVDDTSGALRECRNVLHDRDAKSVRHSTMCWHSEEIRRLKLPPLSYPGRRRQVRRSTRDVVLNHVALVLRQKSLLLRAGKSSAARR